MNVPAKRSIALFVAAVLFLMPLAPPLLAAEDSGLFVEEEKIGPGKIFFDAVLVRPMGVVAVIVGSVGFLVALPFSAATHEIKPTYKHLIKSPVDYTFKRPLGNFDTTEYKNKKKEDVQEIPTEEYQEAQDTQNTQDVQYVQDAQDIQDIQDTQESSEAPFSE